MPQTNGFNVRYLVGSLETKTDRDDWRNNLVILSDEIRVELKDGQRLSIDPKSVRSISYGREATRHVARWVALGILVHPIAVLGLFNENVKHYVSIEYETAEGKKGGLLIQTHKNNYRNVLALLRGATGKEIETEKKNPKKTMKQALVLLILLGLTAATNVAQKPVPSKAVERSRKAANVLESAMANSEARIPNALLSKAVAVAVITEMKTCRII